MINPSILKQVRGAKNWTQDELSDRSHVDKQTISKIERGKRQRVRRHTVDSLCKALGVTSAQLSGDEPLEQGDLEHRSAMTVRVDDGPRNALALAARRYQVRPEGIVELAPFLFTWAAEMSLRQRAERLDELEARQAEVLAMQSNFPHLDHQLTYSGVSDDIIAEERKAIASRDLFGSKMSGDEFVPGLAADFEDHEGPIVRFLQDLAEQIGPNAEFDSWHPLGGPAYAICQSEAAEIVGGDIELAREIIGGNVQLHKMPPELRKSNRMGDRIVWARSEADAARERLDTLMNLDISDL